MVARLLFLSCVVLPPESLCFSDVCFRDLFERIKMFRNVRVGNAEQIERSVARHICFKDLSRHWFIGSTP